MKVLLYTSFYPASDAPIRGVFNHHAFVPLARRCDVQLVGGLPFWRQLRDPRHLLRPRRERGFGIDSTFQTFWSVPSLTALHGAAMYASLRPLVRRLRRRFPWDVILASWAYPDGFAAARFARDAACPIVTNVLGSDVNELPLHRMLKPQVAWGLRQAARVVAVSGTLGEKVVELGVPRERVVVQHNGVDSEAFQPRDRGEARAQLGLDGGRPTILYVGNVKPEKGVADLVEAMAPLVGRHRLHDALLCVVGDGELRGPLEARVAELGVADSVRFVGRRLHDEIPHWMSACDVLCLPSYREGCPNVVIEALASGRPVVASRVGGIPELITGVRDNGVLVRPCDPEALADALCGALRRTWDTAALRRSVEHLSWDAVGAMYHDLLEQVVRERGSGPAPTGGPC